MEPGVLERARGGDRQACAVIVHTHYKRVYGFLSHLTQDAEKAADLTQDVFNTAWQKISTFRGEASLKTWLTRIAWFKYVDAGRRDTRRHEAHQGLQQQWQEPNSVSPLMKAIENEDSRRLYQAVQLLTDDWRSVVVLHYFQGLSLSETAEVLSRPQGTVRWQNKKALEALRQKLVQRDEHDE